MDDKAVDDLLFNELRVGDILSFSQKFYRRGNSTPENEKWEVVERDDRSFTIKSCFDGQICRVELDVSSSD